MVKITFVNAVDKSFVLGMQDLPNVPQQGHIIQMPDGALFTVGAVAHVYSKPPSMLLITPVMELEVEIRVMLVPMNISQEDLDLIQKEVPAPTKTKKKKLEVVPNAD
jgi:hypothetical protein